MTAIEALRYCLETVYPFPDDGRLFTSAVFDKNGEAHWIYWREHYAESCSPTLTSDCLTPFAKNLEPYTEKRQ